MKQQDIMTYDEAHYFDIGEETPVLGAVITQLDENSNPIEKEKQYITDKSKKVTVTGFNNEFPINSDLVKNDKVSEYFYNIFRDRKTGKEAEVDHIIVELWNPTPEGSGKVFKARKITQSVSISSKVAPAGDQITYSGALKGGDFIDGTFDVSSKKFTPTPAAAAAVLKK